MPAFRIRCPACGMQVSQNRLNRDYLPLQFASYVGLGRGRGFRWQKNVNLNDPKRRLLVALRNKLLRLLAAVDAMLGYGYEKMAPSALVTSVPSSRAMTRPASLTWSFGLTGADRQPAQLSSNTLSRQAVRASELRFHLRSPQNDEATAGAQQ